MAGAPPFEIEQTQAFQGSAHIEVGLHPSYGPASIAYLLVKLSYAVDPERRTLRPAQPEALFWDFRVKQPAFKPGTDFWLYKPRGTDVVVEGSAHALGGREVRQLQVGVEVGGVRKDVLVRGRRGVRWQASGVPIFDAPEPFVSMGLGHENAYGGLDASVPIEPDHPLVPAAASDADHPGVYPRNPWGKGYTVFAQPAELELPNLEDPSNPLLPEALLTRDPRLWYMQPLPWYLGWTPLLTFPRYVHYARGVDAWYPGPENKAMPEVRLGFLEENYQSTWPGGDAGKMSPKFRQEASLGLAVAGLRAQAPVRLRSLHPHYQDIGFALPTPPTLEMAIDGQPQLVPPHLTNLRLKPEQLRVELTYASQCELPRALIPGIHDSIDLAARVDGGEWLRYSAPARVKQRIEEALASRAPQR